MTDRESTGHESLVVRNGSATFEVNGLTMAEHLELIILPALRGAPGPVVDIVYDQDTGRSALLKLLATVDWLPFP